MPACYVIDVAHRIVISQALGRLTDSDLWQHQQRLRQDPMFDPTFCQLWDCTGVTAVAVTGEGLRQLATVSVFQPGTPRAIVAPNDAMYGLARMFQTLRGFQGEQIAVFRELADAHAWLEVAHLSAEAGPRYIDMPSGAR